MPKVRIPTAVLIAALILGCGTPAEAPPPHPDLSAFVDRADQGFRDDDVYAALEAELLTGTTAPEPAVRAGSWRDLGTARNAVAELLWPLDSPEPRSAYARSSRASFEPGSWTWRHRAMEAWTEGARAAREAGLEALATDLEHRVTALEQADAARQARVEAETADLRAQLDALDAALADCALSDPEPLQAHVTRIRAEAEAGAVGDPEGSVRLLELIQMSVDAHCD